MKNKVRITALNSGEKPQTICLTLTLFAENRRDKKIIEVLSTASLTPDAEDEPTFILVSSSLVSCDKDHAQIEIQF